MKQYEQCRDKASESFRNELKCSKKLIQKTTELRASRYDVQLCKGSRMISSGDKQEKANVFCVYRQCIEELQEGEHSVKKSFAGSSGDRIHTEVNCQIVVSDFIT